MVDGGKMKRTSSLGPVLWLRAPPELGQAHLHCAASTRLQPIGSLLIASNAEEGEALAQRQHLLANAGLEDAQLLTAAEAKQLEPSLDLCSEGSALLVPSDMQVKALQVHAISRGGALCVQVAECRSLHRRAADWPGSAEVDVPITVWHRLPPPKRQQPVLSLTH